MGLESLMGDSQHRVFCLSFLEPRDMVPCSEVQSSPPPKHVVSFNVLLHRMNSIARFSFLVLQHWSWYSGFRKFVYTFCGGAASDCWLGLLVSLRTWHAGQHLFGLSGLWHWGIMLCIREGRQTHAEVLKCFWSIRNRCRSILEKRQEQWMFVRMRSRFADMKGGWF